MQPVTLYINVNITPPTLYSPSNIPTEEVVSPTEEAALPRRIQSLTLTSTRDLHSGIHQTDEAMNRIDGSDTCERAIRRIKWVMDTLSPIAEVRLIPF